MPLFTENKQSITNRIFRQKRLVATRNEKCPDRLYLTYYLFGQLSERTQMTAFHEKEGKILRHPQYLLHLEKLGQTTSQDIEVIGKAVEIT